MIGGIIDPIKGKIIDSNDFLCNGWIEENQNIDAIKIFVDDIYLGEANFGNKIGGYKNYFSFYMPYKLNDGHHTVRIKLFKKNNFYTEFEPREFFVDKSIAAIQFISVQLTNRCNLNCRWCSVSQFENKQDMDFSVFKKMMRQIASSNMVVNELWLQTAGESLLHPELKQFLDYLGSLKKRPKTTLVTNATCLSDRISHFILSSRGLDNLLFSVDGGTKKSYEWLRRGAIYEKTIDNILAFLKLNNGLIQTGIIAIDLGEVFDENFNNLCKKVNSVEIRPPHNWTGFEKLEGYNISQDFNPFPCTFIKNNLVVRLNGDVAVCCADQIGRGVIGNIEKDHLFSLWKTERYHLFKLQAQGRKSTLSLCEKCSILP
jgi:radical SAM protein with 4Fe4S-binding SPASM domain